MIPFPIHHSHHHADSVVGTCVVSTSSLFSSKTLKAADQTIKNKKKKSKKSVSFFQSVYVKNSLHINDYSDREVAATWYDSHEYAAMKVEIQDLLILLNNKGFFKNEDIPKDIAASIRGIEIRTPRRSRERNMNRKMATESVIYEQFCQREKDVYDDDALAKVYIAATRHCRDTAYIAAQKDMQSAQEWLKISCEIYKVNIKTIESRRLLQRKKHDDQLSRKSHYCNTQESMASIRRTRSPLLSWSNPLGIATEFKMLNNP